MTDTKIEWTDKVWNPTTGCDRVSPGCDHCYAMTLAKRLKGMGSAKYQTDGDPRTSGPGFGVAIHPTALDAPLHWTKPSRVFVNSMSDLFHDEIPDDFIAQVFAVMAMADRHTFQLLTKRHGRMRSLLNSPDFYRQVRRSLSVDHDLSDVEAFGTERFPLPNVWIGVSVEDQRWANIRIPALLDTPAAVRFLSCEPLLGPVCLDAFHSPDGHDPGTDLPCEAWPSGIGWVIVGGESGHGARPMDLDWVRTLREQCTAAAVPFFYKQQGSGDGGPKSRRDLDGRTWDEYPDVVA